MSALNETTVPTNVACENSSFTLEPEVNVVDNAEKLPTIRETPLAISKEPPNSAKTASLILPATLPADAADAAKVVAPPTKVRLFTPPTEPVSKKVDVNDAFRGSNNVAPEDMVIEAV